MSKTPTRPLQDRCLACELVRGLGRALSLVLLPRTFAFVAALVILALMAPSSLLGPVKPPPPDKESALRTLLKGLAASAAGGASAPALASGNAAVAAAQAAVAQANAAASAAQTALLQARMAAGAASASLSPADLAKAATEGAQQAAFAVIMKLTGAAGPASAASAAKPAAAAASAAAPPAPAAAAASAASAAAGGADAAASAPAPAASVPVLRFAPVTALPAGRVGQPWGPRQMVELGTPPYAMGFAGKAPAWLTEYAAGTLAGTPDQAGLYTFTLRAASKTRPDQLIEQSFSIRVSGAKEKAAEAAPKPPFVPQETARNTPQSFRLDLGDDAADPNVDTAPAALKAWQAMLAPLIGVDYPTESQFRSALALAHCQAYKDMLQARRNLQPANERGPALSKEALDKQCYPPVPTPDPPLEARNEARKCAFGLPEPDGSHESLMPPAVRLCLVQQAQRPHPRDGLLPTTWNASPGCGCLPLGSDADDKDEVYAFLSYWGSTQQQQQRKLEVTEALAKTQALSLSAAVDLAKPAPEARTPAQSLDFSMFNRISYFGYALTDVGDYAANPAIIAQGKQLAAAASRHRTDTDLVIYRNDWHLLDREDWRPAAPRSGAAAPARPPAGRPAAGESADVKAVKSDAEQAGDRIDHAAAAAVELLDLPAAREPGGRLAALLPDTLREGRWAFTGLTVFFDNLPRPDSPDGRLFGNFMRAYMAKLIEKMQAKGRPYRLNVVVPYEQMGEQGAYQFDNLLRWVLAAESPNREIDEFHKAGYAGTTDITVRYLVLMPDPATDYKKRLRGLYDAARNVHGETRVALLRRTLPVLQRPPATDDPGWLQRSSGEQWTDDLAYLNWNFRGVSLWDPPTADKVDTKLMEPLRREFRKGSDGTASTTSAGFPGDFVCLNRVVLRLVWLATVLLGVVATLLWMLMCTVRNWGWGYRIFLILGGIWFFVLSIGLLYWDPAIVDLASPYQLACVIGLGVGLGVFLFKVATAADNA